MNRPPFDESVAPAVRDQIEARCQEFERAWVAGRSPSMSDYLREFPIAARPHLVRALLAVEIERRRAAGGVPVTEEQIIEAHGQIAPELRRAFRELPALKTDRGAVNDFTVALEPKAREDGRTIDHTPSRKDSRGLQIRCPHCSNRVVLLTDTPYEEISCSTCGSMFSLVNREESTRMAAPLKTIDRFDLVARLGVGGFGTVWKARDRELDRIVAVKIPRRGQLSPAEVEQFFREARSAAQLRHANIVPVHEVGREGDTFFIVSDFVRGVTLSDWLTGHRPGAWEVVELCIPIADALQHAHQHGVIHRDLKPSNIMIGEDGQPYLMDFGLAKREIGEITMTVDGQILGTPGYMSPEQAGGHGHWTDRRTDVYSLGVIMFELLTGELPFRGNAQMQIHQRLTEDAPDPRKLNRHIPRDLATICLKCLEREPGRRYSSAGELADEFKRFLRGEPIHARPLSAPARLGRWAKRKPMVATTAALTIFLAIAGPLAALMIERQRGRLAELVAEKNNLIDRYAQEMGASANRITDLSKQLSMWEGRTNPWEFWPPKPEQPPRLQALGDLFEVSGTPLANQLRDAKYGSEDTARGYLGLAIMASALQHNSAAQAYYRLAREQLVALRAEDPQRSDLARALAECYTQSALLAANSDRSDAAQNLQHAKDIYQQLAAEDSKQAAYQIALLETELNAAIVAGFDRAKEHLARVAEISQALPQTLPIEPADVYRLACYLTDSEPILSQIAAAPSP